MRLSETCHACHACMLVFEFPVISVQYHETIGLRTFPSVLGLSDGCFRLWRSRCPLANCCFVAHSCTDVTEDAQDVTCKCGASFCFKCKEEAHSPVSFISPVLFVIMQFSCSFEYYMQRPGGENKYLTQPVSYGSSESQLRHLCLFVPFCMIALRLHNQNSKSWALESC